MNAKPQFYFQWHFLEQCNLRCKHCYQKDYKPQKADISTLMLIAERIVDAAKRFGVRLRISLTGGEPFMDRDSLYYLLDYFESKDEVAHVGVLSNGTLITDDDITQLKLYKKLKEVQISLDGASAAVHDMTRGKGMFQKAINSIRKLRENGIFTSAMYTITNLNYHEAVEAVALANRINLNAIAVERATPTGPRCTDSMSIPPLKLKEIFSKISHIKKSKQYGDLLIRTSRPLWCLCDGESGGLCPAGFSCLAILHDGTLLPCRRLEIPIGNIITDGLYTPWYTSPVLWSLRNHKLLNGKCAECEHRQSCRGCRAAAYASGNGVMGEDPFCWK